MAKDTNKNCYSYYSCYSCNYCNYCNTCYYCYSCYSCRNLKMTEYNIFCYSENYNDENSFQQKRYRAFNQEVGKERYNEINWIVNDILDGLKLELNKNSWSEEWKKVTNGQWKQLLEIPEAKDFKEGFEYIAGIEINIEEPKEYSMDEIAKALDIDVSNLKIKKD